MSRNDGRYKILRIPEREVLALVARQPKTLDGLKEVCVTTFPALPDDYEVVSVHHAFEWKCFCFTLWSASFPVVANGAIPDLSEEMRGRECQYLKVLDPNAAAVVHWNGPSKEAVAELAEMLEKEMNGTAFQQTLSDAAMTGIWNAPPSDIKAEMRLIKEQALSNTGYLVGDPNDIVYSHAPMKSGDILRDASGAITGHTIGESWRARDGGWLTKCLVRYQPEADEPAIVPAKE
jgi:hypothetical protein